MKNTFNNASFTSCQQADIKDLFKLYYPRLVHFSYQILHDQSQAEDLVQDTFVKLWNNCHLVSGDSIAIKNYLYTTTKNACLNILRHHKIAENHIQNQHNLLFEEAVLHKIIRSEVLAEIHQAINSLPFSCRQIFRLCYVDGMKNSQVADLLGISINTVKTQKQRGLKVLRLQLRPELFLLLTIFFYA